MAVRALRLEELKTSAGILGIEHVELLGYHDSGMDGWDANQAAEAFWNVPVAESTAKAMPRKSPPRAYENAR